MKKPVISALLQEKTQFLKFRTKKDARKRKRGAATPPSPPVTASASSGLAFPVNAHPASASTSGAGPTPLVKEEPPWDEQEPDQLMTDPVEEFDPQHGSLQGKLSLPLGDETTHNTENPLLE